MKRNLLFAMLLATLSVCAYSAEKKSDITSSKQKFSYAIGFQIGQSLKRDGLDVDVNAMSQAIEDVLSGSKLKLSTEDMQAAIEEFQKKQMKEMNAQAEKNKKAGEEFLAANKKKEGIHVTESGLQYKIIKKGSGKKPKATDTVEVHYKGTLINGEVFDSSYGRGEPTTFPVNRVIKGWQEALTLMSEGSKWEIYVPSDLAYGEKGAGGKIGPNETLIFEVELLKVK